MGSSPRCLISVLAYFAMIMLIALLGGRALQALIQHDPGAMIGYLLLLLLGVFAITEIMRWGIS